MEGKEDKGSPSLYDYVYFDFTILKKALSLREELYNRQSVGLFSGYVYFVEFCIGKMIGNVEEAPYNEHIFEIVNWGRFDLNDQEIRHLRETSQAFKIVFDLNEYVKMLSTLRRALERSEEPSTKKRLEKILIKVEKLCDEINSEIATLYSVKRIEGITDTEEKLAISHWFMVTYVYEPPRMFFSTMTNERALAEVPKPQYLEGFKFCAGNIMNWLTEDKHTTAIENELAELNTLMNLHEFYSKMHGTVFTGNDIARIFNVVEPKWKTSSLIKDKKVLFSYQLNLIFRGREIKVINVIEGVMRSDRSAVQRLFIDVLSGGVVSDGPKVEVVQFEEFVKDGKKDWDKYYTYAIYLPMHGMIGDASSWLIFPRLDGESSREPYDDIRRHLQRLAENQRTRITVRRYKVKNGLLQKYINNEDWGTIMKRDMESRLDAGRGLLAEFLAYFYLWNRHKARLVEFHKEGDNTDVDVIAEDTSTRYIAQAKNSLSVDRKKLTAEINAVIKQFAKVEKTYTLPNMLTRKILFVVDWGWDKKTSLGVDDWDAYLINTYIFASRALNKNNIQLVIYSSIKKLLENGYEDFIKKINCAFDIIEYD